MGPCNLMVKLIFLLTSQLLASLSQEQCADNWYVPNHGSRRPSPFHTRFSDGFALSYSCDDGYELKPYLPVQTCRNGSWDPTYPPKCHKITRRPYCPQPTNITNGVVLCCSNSGSLFNPPDYCCKTNEEVQFECNPGYALTGVSFWKCYGNTWYNSRPPVCQRNGNADPSDSGHVTPLSNSSPFSDGMMRAVVGVSVGVLGLLLLVVVLAFCRPRLRDIKRRWQDFREDENGLIVNGQRVALPTYEEATSVQDQLWCESHQHPPHPCLNSLSSSQLASTSRSDTVTRPPESNITVDDLIVFPTSTSNSTFQLYSGAADDPRSQVQNQPGNDLAIAEFLREIPCSSRMVQDDLVNFDDFSIKQHLPHLTPLTINQDANDCLSASSLLPTIPPGPLEAPSILGDPSSRDDITNREGEHNMNESPHIVACVEVPVDCDISMGIAGLDCAAFSESHKTIKLDQFTVTGDVPSDGGVSKRIDQCEDSLFDSDSTAV